MTVPELRLGVSSVQASALFQVDGDLTRGALPVPRMTTAQRDAIATPATALLVYNTTTNAYNFYSGAAWVALGSSAGSSPAFSTSAQLAALISDETGSGVLVFATSPTLVTPVLGVASGTSLALSGHIGYGGSAVSATDGLLTAENFGNLTTATRGASITSTATLTGNNANVIAAGFFVANMNQNTFNSTGNPGVRSFTAQGNAIGASGTVTAAAAILASANNTGAGILSNGYAMQVPAPANSGGGTYTSYAGIAIAAPTAPTNKTRLLIDTVTIPSGNWTIYSLSTDNSSIGGNLGIGLAAGVAPTNPLSLSGQAAKTIWMERITTANTAGNSLTEQSGGATVGATDKAAGNLIIAPGVSTGSSVPALVILQGGVHNPTTGTGDNALVSRFVPNSFKVLTNNSAITILNATLAASTMIGGVIDYTIEVWNGTDYQVETGRAYFSGGNKAGAFSVTITEVNSQQNVSSGTLATTWAISSANPAAISINANSSLTPSTGYPRISYSVHNFSQQALAVA